MEIKKFIATSIRKYLNENIDELSNIRRYLYGYFNLGSIIEPSSTPIKSGNIRLYHQTDLDNFEKIKKDNKINIDKSTGELNQEPKIVWGSIIKNINDNGFYGKPKERFTIEYQIPSDEVDKGTGGVSRDIEGYEIIAYHDPRMFFIKDIVDGDDYLNSIIESLDFFMTFIDSNPLSSEYAYYLIANAIKNMN